MCRRIGDIEILYWAMQDAVKVCSADPPFYTSHTTLESADLKLRTSTFISIVGLYNSAMERQTHTAGTPVKSTTYVLPKRKFYQFSTATSLADI